MNSMSNATAAPRLAYRLAESGIRYADGWWPFSRCIVWLAPDTTEPVSDGDYVMVGRSTQAKHVAIARVALWESSSASGETPGSLTIDVEIDLRDARVAIVSKRVTGVLAYRAHEKADGVLEFLLRERSRRRTQAAPKGIDGRGSPDGGGHQDIRFAEPRPPRGVSVDPETRTVALLVDVSTADAVYEVIMHALQGQHAVRGPQPGHSARLRALARDYAALRSSQAGPTPRSALAGPSAR